MNSIYQSRIKHKTKNISTSIKSPNALNVIALALFEYFKKNDYYIEAGIVDSQEIEDWKKYLDFVISEREHISKLKGRKSKHIHTGWIIDLLQKYLQKYTEIKADEGTIISRIQASFIYKILDSLDIFPEKLAWEEDNIRHILTNYRSSQRERKSKHKPIDLENSMIEWKANEKRIRSKIKNIIKNK